MLHKTQLHIDEVWTYALSNSTKGPYLYLWRTGIGDESDPTRYSSGETVLRDKENLYFQKWHTGEEFKEYLTVQNGERFRYDTVVYNQSCDVHPPLYYFIVHTICSLFPDSFSVWYAFIPNLAFMVGCVLLLLRIAEGLGLSRKKAVLIALFWAWSRAGVSDMAFLRMYMMLTFITLLSLYVHVRLYADQRARYLVFLFLINLAGFLTQYYYYVFCFFLTAVFCVYFVVRRRIRFGAVYGGSVLCSVGLAILLFPAALKQILHGAYSGNAGVDADSLPGVTSWIDVLLKDFVGSPDGAPRQLYTGVAFAGVALLLILLAVKAQKRNVQLQQALPLLKGVLRRRSTVYWLLLLAAGLTCCLLGLVAPEMPKYQDRYYFNIIPVFTICFVDLLVTAFSKLTRRARRAELGFFLASAVLLVCVVTGNLFPRNNYIDYDRNSTDLADELRGESCFLVLKDEWRLHIYSVYCSEADRVFASHNVNDELYEQINGFQGEKAYILVQYSERSALEMRMLMDRIEYQVSVLDADIETTMGYQPNDALLLVDYTKPK